jgi:carbon monoxide dehydrogenase subunit G
MRMQETVVFNCSQERLWGHIEEPEKQKQWMKGLLSNESTSPGRDGVGSTFRMQIKEGRSVATYDGEVTTHDKPRRLEVRMWGGNFPGGMAMRVDYVLTAVEAGTRLDYTCEMEGKRPGFFLRLMMPLFMIFGRMQLRGFLRTLKRLVETPAVAA